MARDYFLYSLNDTEFEDLVAVICKNWLGEGIIPFAKGKDGGRDAKFNGTAQTYPSSTEPWKGHTVVQAKHTKKPNASCSDAAFMKYFKPAKKDHTSDDKSELPKIKRLIEEEILDNYLVFTNRKLTGGADEKILKAVRKLKLKDAQIVGLERIEMFLRENPKVAKDLPTAGFSKPFEFNPDDMVAIAILCEFIGDGRKSAENHPEILCQYVMPDPSERAQLRRFANQVLGK